MEQHHPHPFTSPVPMRIAVVESNILACMGLERILKQLIPMAEVAVCESFEKLVEKRDMEFIHYFVSSRIYFEHAAYFRDRKGKSIVMVAGEMSVNGAFTLNVCQSEASMIRDLLSLRRLGHAHGGITPEEEHMPAAVMPEGHDTEGMLLSPREVEVALLLCQGYINKEVADRLNIGLTTAITHRKNIMDKLGARSLADVIVYCVMNGLYSV